MKRKEVRKEISREIRKEVRKGITLIGLLLVAIGAYGGRKGFSISETQMILFAPGNLQYQASTNTWRFAEHQYDYIGDGNANISATYTGWIDLFGWGTSGYNGKNPYMTGGSFGDGEKDITGTMYDWGLYNTIGTDPAGTWRLLTPTEWTYLCKNRPNADKLMGKATVAGVKGLVFLPDKWKLPAGLSFTPGGTTNYNANVYTATQWAQMEAASAVFLPAAGFRNVTTLNGVQQHGYYSSSCYYNAGNSYNFSFSGSNYDSSGNGHRDFGLSVRLVHSHIDEYILTVETEQPDYGSVNGSQSDVRAGTTATISATPKDPCYYFDGWSDGVKDNPREVTMVNDTVFEAKFGVYMYRLIVE
ncbi:MAG: hypothetical protein MJZ75_04735 [Paludibacteraceae bacterium]|nr:hypothetical protein [Paludibacteraceae bacterium]